MGLLFNQQIYAAGIGRVATAPSAPALSGLIAQADQLWVEVRGTEATHGGTITVWLQRSADGVAWCGERAPLVSAPLSADAHNYHCVTDSSATRLDGCARLEIEVTETSPTPTVDVWLAGAKKLTTIPTPTDRSRACPES